MNNRKKIDRDYTANSNSIFKILGSSSHTDGVRGDRDYYATSPLAAELLLQNETFDKQVWECACGEKHLSNVLERHGLTVRSSDIVDRCGNEQYDFLSMYNIEWNGHIVTNPPYRMATEFVEKALTIVPDGNKVCMFLRLQFLEGKRRKHLFLSNPPRAVLVFSSRIECAKNGDFKSIAGGSAVAYAWFIWVKGYRGDTVIKWIN